MKRPLDILLHGLDIAGQLMDAIEVKLAV